MDEINIATTPDQVASLMKSGPKTTDHATAPASGASVDEILAQIEKDTMSKEEQAVALEQLQEKSKPIPKPLQLEYKFTGNCECGAEATTLLINSDTGVTLIAFCIKENKQLRTVTDLSFLPNPLPKIEPIPEPVKSVEVAKAPEKPVNDIIVKKEKK